MTTGTLPSTAKTGVGGRIREVGADQREALQTVSRLHMRLLDFGPMAGLGELFIREVCYRLQMKDGLLQVALWEVEGKPAGFAAYTARSISFHREVLRKHFLYVLWILAVSILRDPRRLFRLITALKVVRSRRGEMSLSDGPGQPPLGEVVCLAALPEYLTPQFVQSTGVRVSEELVRHAMRRLRSAGTRRMRMIVNADNRSVLLLYHRLGATFEPYEQGGIPSVQVWFDLDGHPG